MQNVLAKQLVYKYKVNIGVEIENYQQKIFVVNIFQIQLILVAMEKNEFHLYISDYNEQDVCDSHDHIFHLLRFIFESRILVSGMSTVWEDTDGCANKYRKDLDIYLMNFYHLHMVL